MATDQIIEKREETEAAPTEQTRNWRVYRPNVDILEGREELTVLADMPGVNRDSIDIRFENGMLTIHGKVAPRHDAQKGFLLREYGVGDFFREFRVSEAVNAEGISAEYRNGVLTLHLPKVEAAKPRKISVKGA